MKDDYKRIIKQSCITIFFSYCIYFYDTRLIHLLINEITQLGIIIVYVCMRTKMNPHDAIDPCKPCQQFL